jgi:hypothetical protein
MEHVDEWFWSAGYSREQHNFRCAYFIVTGVHKLSKRRCPNTKYVYGQTLEEAQFTAVRMAPDDGIFSIFDEYTEPCIYATPLCTLIEDILFTPSASLGE